MKQKFKSPGVYLAVCRIVLLLNSKLNAAINGKTHNNLG